MRLMPGAVPFVDWRAIYGGAAPALDPACRDGIRESHAAVARILARAETEGRDDDNEQTVANRLRVFDESTKPLVDYYRGRGLLHVVDADRPEAEVTAAIVDVLPG